jgi:hypothetical protein
LLVKTWWYAHSISTGSVEPLDLAVLGRAVRFDEWLSGAESGYGVAEGGATPVGEGVVGDHLADAGDPQRDEPGRGAGGPVNSA